MHILVQTLDILPNTAPCLPAWEANSPHRLEQSKLPPDPHVVLRVSSHKERCDGKARLQDDQASRRAV